MLNQIVLVGRLLNNCEIKELESGLKVANITIACTRSWKNQEGCYDTDFIDIVLFSDIAEKTKEYCKKGDVMGIKGRIETKEIDKEDGTKEKVQEIIAEKVTFLSSGGQ